MPAYIVGVYRHPSREAAERADRMCAPSHEAESADTEIHDAPPVILGGLVKGGEIRTESEWHAAEADALYVAADGRICPHFWHFKAAVRRGALPVSVYRYEAP